MATSPLSTRLQTVQDSADHCNVCKRTIESAIETGALQIVKIGRRTLIDPVDLADFIERQKIRKGGTGGTNGSQA